MIKVLDGLILSKCLYSENTHDLTQISYSFIFMHLSLGDLCLLTKHVTGGYCLEWISQEAMKKDEQRICVMLRFLNLTDGYNAWCHLQFLTHGAAIDDLLFHTKSLMMGFRLQIYCPDSSLGTTFYNIYSILFSWFLLTEIGIGMKLQMHSSQSRNSSSTQSLFIFMLFIWR